MGGDDQTSSASHSPFDLVVAMGGLGVDGEPGVTLVLLLEQTGQPAGDLRLRPVDAFDFGCADVIDRPG